MDKNRYKKLEWFHDSVLTILCDDEEKSKLGKIEAILEDDRYEELINTDPFHQFLLQAFGNPNGFKKTCQHGIYVNSANSCSWCDYSNVKNLDVKVACAHEYVAWPHGVFCKHCQISRDE